MKQVVQAVSGGPVRVLEVPRPTIGPTEVLVRTAISTISPGTEGAVTALAQANLLAKARARPDLVRQVVKRARAQGAPSTLRTVRSRLAGYLPLGYSAAGVAVEVGEAVAHVRPGQMVATGGAGKANHAEYQAVPGLLCAPLPDGVDASEAAFATLATIALHGLRQAEVGMGAKVVVIGLGLVGQLGVRLALAAGYDPFGLDVGPYPVEMARATGASASIDTGAQATAAVLDWSRGRGADAVLVCAAGKGSEIMGRVPELCRDRAAVVVVGDVGLDLDRRPWFERELSLRVSRSYGPGRYERSYEEWGVDYPPGHLRWTEGRNQEAVLDLLASSRLRVADLVTHRYPIDDAASAYALIEGRTEPVLGVQLAYDATEKVDAPVVISTLPSAPSARLQPGIGWIGAGAFSSSTLLPAFKAAGASRLVAVTSASGLSARNLAERGGFARAVTGSDAVIDDPDVDVVVVATPHDSHATLAARALRAGKHVWVEKPLALSEAELDEVEAARPGGGVLFVGFNRRFSPAVRSVVDGLTSSRGPISIVYRVAAGPVPDKHWYRDRRQGGRLLGEVCHFVDACAAIIGQPARSVRVVAGGDGETLMAQDLAVALSYPDGSLATIAYSSAEPAGLGKEKVEILRGPIQATIDDFRKVTVNNKVTWSGAQDKGHAAAVSEFLSAVQGGQRAATEVALLESSRTVIEGVASLLAANRPG